MLIAFVTFGNYDAHSTLKRATGMAGPLIRAGHEVHLLMEEHPSNRHKIQLECPEASVIWHQRHDNALAERKVKQRSLEALSPDVVWICGVGLRNWVFRTRVGQVVIGDHSELYSSVGNLSPVRRLWEQLLEWMHILSFQGHICASRYLEKLYKKRISLLRRGTPVHYSPYAYTNELIEQPKRILNDLYSQYSGVTVFLYMGSFWENYGFWDMLYVFRDLYYEHDNFQAMLMGRGPEKEKGIKWLEENGISDRITILGYIPEEDLSSYFELADAFICPLRETIQDKARCPSKLFMYLPFGKPIITCRIGEAFELFGNDGLYYNPGDRGGLKSCLEGVLGGVHAQSNVSLSEHSWEARTRKFLEWMEEAYPEFR
jgi:glycosyltransferase involved in cell wall biosynthesis